MVNKNRNNLILIIFITTIICIFFYYTLDSGLNKNIPIENDENIIIRKQSDWIIENHTIINSTTLYNGSITIQNSGLLEISAELIINSSSNYQYNITINENGILKLNNGKINSTKKMNIYSNNNSSIILSNFSRIDIDILIFDNNNITMENSQLNSNIKGNTSKFDIYNCQINITKNSFENATLDVSSNLTYVNNSNLVISGKNCNIKLKSINSTLNNFTVSSDPINTTIGGNSNLNFNTNQTLKLKDSFFYIFGGNSTINNGGNSTINIKSNEVKIYNTDFYNTEGLNNGSLNNGIAFFSISNIKDIEINNSNIYNSKGYLNLACESYFLINNSKILSRLILFPNNNCNLTVVNSILGVNNKNNLSSINITDKTIQIKNSVLNSENLYFNISKNLYILESSKINGSLFAISEMIEINDSSLNNYELLNNNASIYLNSEKITINSSLIDLSSGNCIFKINAFNTTINNTNLNIRGLEGDVGGNVSIMIISNFNIIGNNLSIYNIGGKAINYSSFSGYANIKLKSNDIKLLNSTIDNFGGNKSNIFIDGGLSNITLEASSNLRIEKSKIRNYAGSSVNFPLNDGGNSTFFINSENFSLIDSIIGNFGGISNDLRGGNASLELKIMNFKGLKSSIINKGGNSKEGDNSFCYANLSLWIKNLVYMYKMNINNIGGSCGTLTTEKGGSGGHACLLLKNGSNQSNKIIFNDTQIINTAGNGGNSSYSIIPGIEGGDGGFAYCNITGELYSLNGSIFFNEGGNGGNLLINTSFIKNAGNGGDSSLFISTLTLLNNNKSISIENSSIYNSAGNGGDSYNLKGNSGDGGDSLLKFTAPNIIISNKSIIESVAGNGGGLFVKNNFNGSIGGNSTFTIKNRNIGFLEQFILKINAGYGGFVFSKIIENGSIYLFSSIKKQFIINQSNFFLNDKIDLDNDNITNIEEFFIYKTSVFKIDTDNDKMPDPWEIYYQLNATFGLDNLTDADNDGLLNLYEYYNRTHPMISDTDGDLLNDGEEVNIYRTDPNNRDTDGDNLIDGLEVNIYNTNPKSVDTDGDLLNDWIDPVKTFPLEFVIIILFIGLSVYIQINNYITLIDLRKEYDNKRMEIDKFFISIENELNIIVNKINIISKNLNKLILYEYEDVNSLSSKEISKKLNFYHDFIGIDQLYGDLSNLENDFENKMELLSKKYYKFHFLIEYSKRIHKTEDKFNHIIREIDKLKWKFQDIFYNTVYKESAILKIKYKIQDLDVIQQNIIENWTEKFNEFTKDFEGLLNNKKIDELNSRLANLEKVFEKGDNWLEKALEWSRNIPIPADVGYKYKLTQISRNYKNLKHNLTQNLTQYKKEISNSIEFARNHISWNLEQFKKRQRIFEKNLFEEILRYLSTMITDYKKIEEYIENKFQEHNKISNDDMTEIQNSIKINKEYPIADLEDDFQISIKYFNENMKKLKEKVQLFIDPALKLVQLIKYFTNSYYKKFQDKYEILVNKIEELNLKEEDISSKVSKFANKTIQNIEKITIDIEKLFNDFPFQIETQYLVILTRDWNEKKDEMLNTLNLLSKKKKVYKCEIMHEILDPETDDIWQCENCGTIVCGEHLEKWYFKKKSPECFKCGKIGTFKPLKIENINKN